MSSSGYAAWSVVFGEQPTATKWNILGSNDSSFNLGTGFEDSVIINRHLAAGAVTVAKLGTGATDLGYTSGSPATVIPNAYTTYATITATTTGGAVRLIGSVSGHDGNSGAGRTGHVRFTLDGSAIANTDQVWQTISNGARFNVSMLGQTAASAASHTFALQVEADTASASLIDTYSFSVQEVK